MAMNPVGILVIEFHDLCSSMDCIRPTVHCSQFLASNVVVIVIELEHFALAFVVDVRHLSRSSQRIVLALELNRQPLIPMATAPPTIAVYCNRPVNQAIDISSVLVDIDSYRSFDAFQGTLMLEWMHHNWLVVWEWYLNSPYLCRAIRLDESAHHSVNDVDLLATVIVLSYSVAHNELD